MKRSCALAREIVHLLTVDQVDGGPLAPELRQALRDELSRCPHDPQDKITEAGRDLLLARECEELADEVLEAYLPGASRLPLAPTPRQSPWPTRRGRR